MIDDSHPGVRQLKNAADMLREHFDTVDIVASIDDEEDPGHAGAAAYRSGDLDQRQDAIIAWLGLMREKEEEKNP